MVSNDIEKQDKNKDRQSYRCGAGALKTFLNAMTYPDKTVYPVASCNDKDFHNLMDVYMDAVLHPNIYKEEKIFRQEAGTMNWRARTPAHLQRCCIQ